VGVGDGHGRLRREGVDHFQVVGGEPARAVVSGQIPDRVFAQGERDQQVIVVGGAIACPIGVKDADDLGRDVGCRRDDLAEQTFRLGVAAHGADPVSFLDVIVEDDDGYGHINDTLQTLKDVIQHALDFQAGAQVHADLAQRFGQDTAALLAGIQGGIAQGDGHRVGQSLGQGGVVRGEGVALFALDVEHPQRLPAHADRNGHLRAGIFDAGAGDVIRVLADVIAEDRLLGAEALGDDARIVDVVGQALNGPAAAMHAAPGAKNDAVAFPQEDVGAVVAEVVGQQVDDFFK